MSKLKIEILGTGCKKCKETYSIVEKAINEEGIDAEIVKIQDIAEIAGYGVMQLPAIAIDGDVKIAGRIPSVNDVKELLK